MFKSIYFKIWILLIIITTAFCGLVYVEIQQSLRLSSNDPQIQLAEDIALILENGKQPSDFNTLDKMDITKSLGTFLIIYDDLGKPVVGTGMIDNNLPKLPQGVFEYVKIKKEDRITWQPQKNTRIALVVASYKNGFVAVGRSIREIEIREDKTLQFSALAWFLANLATFIFCYAFYKMKDSI